jgi:hypothetical protein
VQTLSGTTVYWFAAPSTCSPIYAAAAKGVYTNTGGWASAGLAGKSVMATWVGASSSSHAYGATYGQGVYETSDYGASWTAINSGLESLYVTALTDDGAAVPRLYAGTWGGGVYTRTSTGPAWAPFSTGLPDPYITALTADLSKLPITTTVYAGTLNSGLYRSTNRNDWQRVFTVPTTTAIWITAVMTDGTPYVGTDDGVYNVRTGIQVWSTSPLPVYALAIEPKAPDILYVGVYGDGVYRLDVSAGLAQATRLPGLSGQALNVLGLAVSPPGCSPRTLYAGTADGIWEFRSF